jgi:NAD(P)-dependent dehydrogenase (short-subunit alcohol dehydrogenase family)
MKETSMGNKNKVAVITGAADGIGWATAQCLVADGWNVALIDMNNELVKERANALGDQHSGWSCNVTDTNLVKQSITEIFHLYGRIDALVNNAGIGDQTGPTLEQDIQVFDHVLSVHLRGAFLMSQNTIAIMLKQGRDMTGVRGAIVNIGSIASFGGIPGRNAYSAAKAGVLGMTRTLASEWARKGIRVNAVAPGYIASSGMDHYPEEAGPMLREMAKTVPLGRFGTEAETSAAIVYLLSPAASFVSGSTLRSSRFGTWKPASRGMIPRRSGSSQ